MKKIPKFFQNPIDKCSRVCYNRVRKEERTSKPQKGNKMKNINEYFNNLYKAATTDEKWEEVHEYETAVYNMENEEFFKWAKENEIDLNAKEEGDKYTVLTYWYWDMEEAGEYGD